jgi:RNA polymerase sigma-70 factor, ECF subfamily
MGNQDSTTHDDQVVQLIANCQRPLFLYVWGLLFSQELAEDVLQETNLVLWRKRAEYVTGTNFFAWACRIAMFEVRKARDRHRHRMPVFSELFLDQLAPEIQTLAEEPSQLQVFLQECVEQLSDYQRDLLERRYADGATTIAVAGEVGRSIRTVNRTLSHIHQVLFDCISVKLTGDQQP